MEIVKKFLDGGIPLLYGISSLCSGLGVIGMLGSYVYQVINETRVFSMSIFSITLIGAALLGFMVYLLLLLGVKEIKKKS